MKTNQNFVITQTTITFILMETTGCFEQYRHRIPARSVGRCDDTEGFSLLKAWGLEAPESGLLSNQGEKSINFYFIMVPLRKKY